MFKKSTFNVLLLILLQLLHTKLKNYKLEKNTINF